MKYFNVILYLMFFFNFYLYLIYLVIFKRSKIYILLSGISILYKKSTKSSPSLFSFLAPFSAFVWLWVITAYCGVSVLLFIMARISPYEWTNPYPCIEEPEYLENQFSLSNAFWFTIGSLMQQGSDIAPM